jgi:hypothetical protein
LPVSSLYIRRTVTSFCAAYVGSFSSRDPDGADQLIVDDNRKSARIGEEAELDLLQSQDLPSQFVISGETARKIHNFTTINLATADAVPTSAKAAQSNAAA